MYAYAAVGIVFTIAFALVILAPMATTSHANWLRNLTPPVWKTLRMVVYLEDALS